jgi:hypothetical protein
MGECKPVLLDDKFYLDIYTLVLELELHPKFQGCLRYYMETKHILHATNMHNDTIMAIWATLRVAFVCKQ